MKSINIKDTTWIGLKFRPDSSLDVNLTRGVVDILVCPMQHRLLGTQQPYGQNVTCLCAV